VEAFTAWRQFCEAICEDGPGVLVFEDLHWADDALLDFVDTLSERATGVPLLILCTARPELLDRRPGWGGGKPNALTISLGPLSDEDTARLVSAVLDQALLPAETQVALLSRAEGNPLYAQEYVRMLRDRDLLVQDGAGWRLAETPGGAELPASVAGIIAARLDALSPEEKRIVQDASVIGRTAWIAATAAVGETSSDEVSDLVHRLERKQILRRQRRSSISGDDEFVFAHSLTQEVAYAQIPRAARVERHLRAARWIEQLTGERDDKAELLAHHYVAALRLLEQTGADTGAVVPRTRAALAAAGRQAAATNAHLAAANHFQAALDLATTNSPDRPGLLLDGATALWRANRSDEHLLLEALDAQLARHDWEAAAWAERLLSDWAETHAHDGAQTDEHLRRAAEYAVRAPLTARTAYVDNDRAYRLVVQGRGTDAIALAEHGMRRAEEAGLTEARALLLMWRGYARIESGDEAGASDMEEAAATLARHAHRGAVIAYGNFANLERGMGHLHRSGTLFAEARTWAERFAEPHYLSWLAAEQANLAYHAGRWPDALAMAQGVTEEQDTTRALILLASGRVDEALAATVPVIDFGFSTNNSQYILDGLATRVLAHDRAGSPGDAGAACDDFLAEWNRIGGMLTALESLARIAPLIVTNDRHEDLARAARLVATPSRWSDAVAAIAEGRYRAAADIYGEVGSLPGQAAAHVLAAAEFAVHGRSSEARPHLEAARAFYLSVEATAYLREVTALLPASA
jgi:hypothetical protein